MTQTKSRIILHSNNVAYSLSQGYYRLFKRSRSSEFVLFHCKGDGDIKTVGEGGVGRVRPIKIERFGEVEYLLQEINPPSEQELFSRYDIGMVVEDELVKLEDRLLAERVHNGPLNYPLAFLDDQPVTRNEINRRIPANYFLKLGKFEVALSIEENKERKRKIRKCKPA